MATRSGIKVLFYIQHETRIKHGYKRDTAAARN